MNNLKKIGSIFAIATTLLILSLTTVVLAQGESTSSATINDEEINQNIKDRIKKVASQSGSLTAIKKKIAFIGSIQNIANETLTIKTKDEIKLASTSASTTYVRIPGNANQKLADISIGDYAIAMGYINGSDVLETKRVILQSGPPEATKKTSVAGIISYIESDEGVIHILFEDQVTSVEVTKNTTLMIQANAQQNELDFTDLKKGQFVTAIYIPIDDPDEFTHPKALTILATSIIKEVPSDNPTATKSAQMEEELKAEIEPTTPPELEL
jgi:hypothetical protein